MDKYKLKIISYSNLSSEIFEREVNKFLSMDKYNIISVEYKISAPGSGSTYRLFAFIHYNEI